MARAVNIQSDDYQLGQKIRKFRRLRKMTQDQLGELMDTDRANISKYENGMRGEMSYKMIKRFARALEIPASVLVGEDDDLGEILVTAASLNKENRSVVLTTVKALLYMQTGTGQ